VVTEYCVSCAAKGLLQRGRQVSIVKDAIESLAPAGAGQNTLDELRVLGAKMISTDEAVAKADETHAKKIPAQ
jgi:nicotinamidase-related amidase